MEWKCNECNMKFQSVTLYETHKQKYCVLRGRNVDPRQLNNQGIANGTRRRNSPGEAFEKHSLLPSTLKTVHLPGIQVAPHQKTLSTKDNYEPMYYKQSHHDMKKMEMPSFTVPLSTSAHINKELVPSEIEMEKIKELKKLKDSQSKKRAAQDFEEKLLIAGVKDKPLVHSATRYSERVSHKFSKEGANPAYEEKLNQLSKGHDQQLHELQERNKKLEQEKAVIQNRIRQLKVTSEDQPLMQGSLDEQSKELQRLGREIEYNDVLNRLLKQPAREIMHSDVCDRKSSTLLNRESGTRIIPYDRSNVRQFSQTFPLSAPGGGIVDELNFLKSMYVERGGCNPAVLNQIQELEYEAHRLKNTNKPVGLDPVIQQQIMAQQLHNQRLEQELKLLREGQEHSRKDKSPSPELSSEYTRLKEEHMTKMTQLKHESEILKQQSEIAKMKKLLRELENEDVIHKEDKTASEDPFALTRTGMEKTLSPSPYDPKGGFIIFWDFIVGVHPSFIKCRIAVGVYDGTSLVTDVKVFPLARVTVEPQRDPLSTSPSGGFVLLAIKHPFPRCAPRPTLSLVVELQASSNDGTHDPDKLHSMGWTKMDLFDSSIRVVSGRWKMPLREPPIKASLNMHELNRISQVGQAELCFRIVNKRDEASEEILSPKPLHHHLFSFPPMESRQASYSVRGRPSLAPLSPIVPSVPPPPDSPVSQVLQSVPGTPATTSFVGFQVDQIIDAIEGEATVEITAYSRTDGKVLRSLDNVPISFKTTPVEQEFLHGVHVFGLQQRQFRAVMWDLNSFVVLRLYIQPRSRQTQDAEEPSGPADNNKLTAWTVLPLALLLDSRNSSSHRDTSAMTHSTRSMASLDAVPRLNTGTHKLPLFFPPLPDLRQTAVKSGHFPEEWQRCGQATAIFSVFSSLFQAPEISFSPTVFYAEDQLPQKVWIKHNRTTPVMETFDAGQGFDLYIDGARFLPDSVTFSKVAGRVMDKGYGRFGPEIDVQAALDSDVYNPEYNSRFEYREPVVHPTSTLMLKVYTVDRVTQQLCCLGYVLFALFLELGTSQQPSHDSETKLCKEKLDVDKLHGAEKVALNEGAHQLRIYNGSPDFSRPLSEELVHTLKPVPCASLLIRLYKAACHPNGRPKEISQFPEDEWEQEGLLVPKPSYEEGAYISLPCEPTSGESQMFHSMVKRSPITVRQSVNLLGSGQEQKMKNDNLILSWIKSQLTRSIDSQPVDFDMLYVSHYHPLHGLKVSLDAAQNIPWSGVTMATLTLSPPGAFYMGDTKDPLVLFSKLSFSNEVSSPVWTDGFKWFPRRSYQKNLVVIIHLHEIVFVDNSEHGSEAGQAWTAVPIFDEGYVRNGCYQLPLYHHKPTQVVLDALQHDTCQDVLAGFRRRKVENVSLEYLPRDKLDKYTNVNPSNLLASLIPKSVDEEEFSHVLFNKFRQLIKNNFEENRSGTAQ